MTWYNPKTWFRKKGEGVYLAVTLDVPYITGVSRSQPRKPWVFVQDLAFEDAAKQTLRINWHTVPMGVRSRLELGDRCFSISLEDAKGVLEGF